MEMYGSIDNGKRRSTSTGRSPSVSSERIHLILVYSLAVMVALLALSFCAGYWLVPSVSSKLSTSTQESTSEFSFTNPTVLIYNEYTKNQTVSYYLYENIVEPYRVTYFEVASADENLYEFQWYVDGWHLDDGAKVSITFNGVTNVEQEVILTIKEKATLATFQKSIKVMCKYVRRELRSLLEQDRVALLQAISIMQRVPVHTGKILYGANYRSKDFFNRIHLYFGGSKSCDHWHQVNCWIGCWFFIRCVFFVDLAQYMNVFRFCVCLQPPSLLHVAC
jgi:hypothetical protein